MQSLTTVTNLVLGNSPSLPVLSLPSLSQVIGAFTITSLEALTSISLPSFISDSSGGASSAITWTDVPMLHTIDWNVATTKSSVTIGNVIIPVPLINLDFLTNIVTMRSLSLYTVNATADMLSVFCDSRT
jgi:hypothetical protein